MADVEETRLPGVGVRYDFTASPDSPQWSRVDLSG